MKHEQNLGSLWFFFISIQIQNNRKDNWWSHRRKYITCHTAAHSIEPSMIVYLFAPTFFPAAADILESLFLAFSAAFTREHQTHIPNYCYTKYDWKQQLLRTKPNQTYPWYLAVESLVQLFLIQRQMQPLQKLKPLIEQKFWSSFWILCCCICLHKWIGLLI